MAIHDPIEFTKQLPDGNYQRVGNEVSIGEVDPTAFDGVVIDVNVENIDIAINLEPNPNDVMRKLDITGSVVTILGDAVPVQPFHVDTTHILMTFEGGSIRYTDDGVTVPTSAYGHLVRAEMITTQTIGWATLAHFIRTTSLSGVAFITPLMPTP